MTVPKRRPLVHANTAGRRSLDQRQRHILEVTKVCARANGHSQARHDPLRRPPAKPMSEQLDNLGHSAGPPRERPRQRWNPSGKNTLSALHVATTPVDYRN